MAKRPTSIVPQQYLFFMNSPFFHDRARALAAKLEGEGGTLEERVTEAYRTLHHREPRPEELALSVKFIDAGGATEGKSGLTAWQQLCQVLLSSNELLFVR